MTRDFNRENPNATWEIVPGLRFLPFNIFGWIDNSTDPTCTPLSGHRGNYAGAARREEYAEAQRAVYTGYKKLYGIKVETVILPKLKMSNLDVFCALFNVGYFLFFWTVGGSQYFM